MIVRIFIWARYLRCGILNKGDGIAVYGPVGPNMTSAYKVQIDNGTSASFSAQKIFYRPQQILFLVTNLGAGSHLLSIELETGGVDDQLAIDYANVFTTKSLGGRYASNRLSELHNIHVASANFNCYLAP